MPRQPGTNHELNRFSGPLCVGAGEAGTAIALSANRQELLVAWPLEKLTAHRANCGGRLFPGRPADCHGQAGWDGEGVGGGDHETGGYLAGARTGSQATNGAVAPGGEEGSKGGNGNRSQRTTTTTFDPQAPTALWSGGLLRSAFAGKIAARVTDTVPGVGGSRGVRDRQVKSGAGSAGCCGLRNGNLQEAVDHRLRLACKATEPKLASPLHDKPIP